MASPPPAAGFWSHLPGLFTGPRREWPRIAADPARGLVVRVVLPLAAISPVARLIGTTTFGWSARDVRLRPTVEGAVVTALAGYVLAVLGTLFVAFALAGTAPSFGGAKDKAAATKVAVYSAVPLYLSGVFQLLPALTVLGVLGAYGFWLLYLGAAPLLRVPPERARPFALSMVAAAIVAYVAVFGATAAVSGSFTPLMTRAG